MPCKMSKRDLAASAVLTYSAVMLPQKPYIQSCVCKLMPGNERQDCQTADCCVNAASLASCRLANLVGDSACS